MVDGQDALRIVPGSSLGILREDHSKSVAASFAALPPEVRAYARTPDLLIVTKANARSTVHRPGYLDYVGIKRFDGAGKVCGEHRFLGLYTSMAYSANLPNIPLLRRKAANVIARAGVARGSHAGKALVNILESYPRDELFQTSEDDLLRAAMGILHLGERQRFRLFVRRDAFERFVVVHDLFAARDLHDRIAGEVAGDPARGVQRHELGIQRVPVGVAAGAGDDHRAHDARPDSRRTTCARSRPVSRPRRDAGTTISATL